jgi:isopenicillin N synthase-like dioxygenase
MSLVVPSSNNALTEPACRYKASGANAVDESGQKDTVEFMNISKDDALSFPTPTHRTYPSTVVARMESTVRPFIEKSLEVNNTILEVFNEKLGLPEGELVKRHARDEWSGSEARVIKKPPMPEMSPEQAALGAHTDFGSLVGVVYMVV